MQLPVHRWFRYSAGFSAEWAESVIKTASGPEVHVLDPFAGSATTLIAAQSAQGSSVGTDSHPFVSRIAQAKLLWPSDYGAFEQRARTILTIFKPIETPAGIPRLLSECYSPQTLSDLLGLRDCLNDARQGDATDELLWLAFVAIIRTVSHAGTAQWQYILPSRRKSMTPPVRTAFHEQVRTMAQDMAWSQERCPSPPVATYYERDARDAASFPESWATHVICSPPYTNNYDYADATRLEQTVLGEVSGWGDLRATRQKLIRSCSQQMSRYDASQALDDPLLKPIISELSEVYEKLSTVRTQHGGKKAYHDMILAYFHDLARVWVGLRRACRPNCQVCFVVGDSAPYGVHVPVERWLAELALSAGFRSWHFEKVRDRNVKWKNRKHSVPLHEGRLWIEG